ncbi:hypothetical protein HJB76_02245 [Rhizobium lentis]|uniref:hypothetical protein n=1 Tax=Rhizobium lentis TaxID=1138194 RepID=UPI001C82D127|nr:hypothetical protein [Rhizobium lentis]MBX4954314.1 hypothetical protein [Rhizobium lentis]
MKSPFDADEILSQYGDTQTSVLLWRPGRNSSSKTFGSLWEALEFAKVADTSNVLSTQFHVHVLGNDMLIEGDNLNALLARGGGGNTNDDGGYGNGGTGDGGG